MDSSDLEILQSIDKKLQEMRDRGLQDTDEYENLSDEWQCLAQNILEGKWLDDETVSV